MEKHFKNRSIQIQTKENRFLGLISYLLWFVLNVQLYQELLIPTIPTYTKYVLRKFLKTTGLHNNTTFTEFIQDPSPSWLLLPNNSFSRHCVMEYTNVLLQKQKTSQVEIRRQRLEIIDLKQIMLYEYCKKFDQLPIAFLNDSEFFKE